MSEASECPICHAPADWDEDAGQWRHRSPFEYRDREHDDQLSISAWGVFDEQSDPPRLHVALCEPGTDAWPAWHTQETTCWCQPRVETETTSAGTLAYIVIHRQVPAA